MAASHSTLRSMAFLPAASGALRIVQYSGFGSPVAFQIVSEWLSLNAISLPLTSNLGVMITGDRSFPSRITSNSVES